MVSRVTNMPLSSYVLFDIIIVHYNTREVKRMRTRKLSYRKDDRAMRPIYGCPDNFESP